MVRTFVLLWMLVLQSVVSAQYDFNEYMTLSASGEVPADFTQSSYTTLERAVDSNYVNIKNDIDRRLYLQRIIFSIDELLHSGYVVYGDEISKHVEQIANKLLADHPSVRAALRFYTIKSDRVNLFKTEQGIIFVTTGLIAQVENDAQLAFLLAHEIAHYLEKDEAINYSWSSQLNRMIDWTRSLSRYAIEDEKKADDLAFEMCQKAGFDLGQIDVAFDVLLYSYLPFNEVEITPDYFKSDSMFVPEEAITLNTFKISDREEVSNRLCEFPHMDKRRAGFYKTHIIDKSSASGNRFISSEENFEHLRNLARFESVRAQIIDVDLVRALYSIHVLQQQYPNSIYLKRLKAQAWLGIFQYNIRSNFKAVAISPRHVEGQLATLNDALLLLPEEALTAFAVRNVVDAYLENPDDSECKAIYLHLIKEMGYDEKFDLYDYARISFDDAAANALKGEDTTMQQASNKYETIKKNRDPNEIAGFDSTKYYLYGIHDVLNDQEFIGAYEAYRKEIHLREIKEKEYLLLPSSEQRKYDKKHGYDHLKVEVNHMIILEPRVKSYTDRGNDFVRSELLEKTFEKAFVIAADKAGTRINLVSGSELGTGGSARFNERNVLMIRLNQMLNNDDVATFPVDFSMTSKLTGRLGTNKVLFSIVDHTYSPDFNFYLIASSLLFPIAAPFVLPVHVPTAIISGNLTGVTMVLVDVETGKIESYDRSTYETPLNEHNIAGHLYILFKHFNSAPSE